MKYDEFLGAVQQRAHLHDRASAERAVRACLSTLADRLEPGAAENLAGQLPSELASELQRSAAGELEKLSLDEFLARVSERENADLPVAVHHARAVIDVLREAVGEGSFDKLRQQLPQEYDRLLLSGAEGSMPPQGSTPGRSARSAGVRETERPPDRAAGEGGRS